VVQGIGPPLPNAGPVQVSNARVRAWSREQVFRAHASVPSGGLGFWRAWAHKACKMGQGRALAEAWVQAVDGGRGKVRRTSDPASSPRQGPPPWSSDGSMMVWA
jgi:hypothetical protein